MKFVPKYDNLFRGLASAPAVRHETRADGDDDPVNGTLLHGHFALFDEWTEIHSWYEGDFLERLAPGTFAKTIAEGVAGMRVQLDHGYDAFVGDAPLGPIDVLREDDTGAYYEVPLLDTDYNRNRVLPLLEGRLMSGERRGSQLGASFRFRVIKDEWNEEPERSEHNPDGLPERTIREVRLFEFGPVVFPAYAGATAKVRCLTDDYLDRERAKRSGRKFDTEAADVGTSGIETDEPPAGHSTANTGARMARALADIETLRRVRP